MHGTPVCAVTDGAENDDAVAQAVAVSERIGLRLVLAHVVGGIAPLGNGDGETITMKGDRKTAERQLEELARGHDLGESAERRVAGGDPATLLGQIASEETDAQDLETETPVPVLIAPPRRRR